MMKRIGAYMLMAVITIGLALPMASAVAAGTRVARCDLRLRKEASTKADVLATIPGGTELTVLGTSGGWTKTTYNGHTGYASSAHLMELTKSGYYPLKEGDENPYVTEMQKRLIQLGYMTGNADGNFGESTLIAVKSFQKANKMKQDGVAGGETQRVMFSDKAIAAQGGSSATATATAQSTGTATAAATATATNTPSAKTLRMGDRGEDVKSLQARLIELGYLSGKADGIFGLDTQKAVVAFQKISSLSSDGKAGKATQNLLYSNGAKTASGAQSAATALADASDYKTLKRGMTNNLVKNLQQALKDLGYMAASATGFYGSQTQLAVESFQKANNLNSDGIAGAATQMLLFSSNAKPNAGDTNANAGTTYATLKEGMKSSAVTTMQKKLRELGYLSANATGFYGSATREAIMAFQKANRLNADGIAGSATLTTLYSSNPIANGGSSASGSGSGGAGKIGGPDASSVKLLHWFNSVKPSLKSNSVVQVYDPVSGYGFKIKALSLGRHFDSEPLTAEDTLYMNAAFGNVTTWTPKPVWVKLPTGTWVLATMHNTPHLSGNISNNNFNGHLCIHFLRDMDECAKNDPNYGVQHQKAIREAWKKLSGQTVD